MVAGRRSLTDGLPKMPPTQPIDHGECPGCDGCGRWWTSMDGLETSRCEACRGTGRRREKAIYVTPKGLAKRPGGIKLQWDER